MPARLREQIALAVAQANECEYCLAAHSAVGRMVGLTAEQIRDSRLGTAVDPKADALIRFALKVVDVRGSATTTWPRSDRPGSRRGDHRGGRQRGALCFTDYFNRLAETDLDFPAAPASGPESRRRADSSRSQNPKGPTMDIPTIVVKPGEGRAVWLGGMGVVFKVSGADTGGTFAVVEHPIEPGRLVLPHVHTREDEYSYVLEGTIRAGRRPRGHRGAGQLPDKPRGLMHTFWNSGPGPARLLEVISPAGFEAYFAELADAADPAVASSWRRSTA